MAKIPVLQKLTHMREQRVSFSAELASPPPRSCHVIMYNLSESGYQCQTLGSLLGFEGNSLAGQSTRFSAQV